MPLVGPHAGYEAELLLAGKKPVGLFVDKTPPPEIIEDFSAHMEKVRSDIRTLDKAVREGSLIKHSHSSIDQQRFTWMWHYYCQPDQVQQMLDLCELIAAANENREPNFKPTRQIGEYFGYTKADIRLFNAGGYSSLPWLLSYIMRETHQFRKACRLSNEIDGPIVN